MHHKVGSGVPLGIAGQIKGFIRGNKGMEMWQLVLIILALLLLFFMLVWSGELGDKMSSLLSGFGEMF